MTKIEAKIIAHSSDTFGNELITYELIFPRFILAELNTHRAFSKNSASSRAIPFKKMAEMVQNDPFIPIAWQKNHKGMQGTEYITNSEAVNLYTNMWLQAADYAIRQAEFLSCPIKIKTNAESIEEGGVTKQLCNRLLEPFMWHKVILTTGLEGLRNFFELRCSNYKADSHENQYPQAHLHSAKSKKEAIKLQPTLSSRTDLEWLQNNRGQAEIHMMELAEQMYDAYNESKANYSPSYHIPYEDKIRTELGVSRSHTMILNGEKIPLSMAISAMMCARVSYTTIGDNMSEWTVEKYLEKFNDLITSVPAHSSPLEHVAFEMSDEEYYLYSRGKDGSASHEHGWCRNFRGFIQLRDFIEK